MSNEELPQGRSNNQCNPIVIDGVLCGTVITGMLPVYGRQLEH